MSKCYSFIRDEVDHFLVFLPLFFAPPFLIGFFFPPAAFLMGFFFPVLLGLAGDLAGLAGDDGLAGEVVAALGAFLGLVGFLLGVVFLGLLPDAFLDVDLAVFLAFFIIISKEIEFSFL